MRIDLILFVCMLFWVEGVFVAEAWPFYHDVFFGLFD